jgi:hypothetical protein
MQVHENWLVASFVFVLAIAAGIAALGLTFWGFAVVTGDFIYFFLHGEIPSLGVILSALGPFLLAGICVAVTVLLWRFAKRLWREPA